MGAQVAGISNGGYRRVVIVQPHFGQGGAESVAAWIVQAIKDLAPVTVLTFDALAPVELNRRFGTQLKEGDFEVARCRFPFRKGRNLKWTILKLHWLMRQCKAWPEKDVLFFSASSEMDFGRPGVQYVEFPLLAEAATRSLGLLSPKRWYHRSTFMRAAYLCSGRLLSRFSLEGVKANYTLTASDWTREVMCKVYGVEGKTVYPPVTLEFPHVPFANREYGFVCLGRITPSKRILEIIGILQAVREQGFDVHLHIIGPEDDPKYMKKVKAALHRHQSWVFLEGALDRTRVAEMLAQHRFGIHGMPYEHFGIAVAEMAKAGCIVFVPNSGGQVEIVDKDERLVYSSEQEAVEKITKLLANEREQELISREMKARGARFSAERFVTEIRKVVGAILEGS